MSIVIDHIDNGAQGVRPEFSGTYYAAFVLDPDGRTRKVRSHFSTEQTPAGVAMETSE